MYCVSECGPRLKHLPKFSDLKNFVNVRFFPSNFCWRGTFFGTSLRKLKNWTAFFITYECVMYTPYRNVYMQPWNELDQKEISFFHYFTRANVQQNDTTLWSIRPTVLIKYSGIALATVTFLNWVIEGCKNAVPCMDF